MTIVYALVAKGSLVLAEHTAPAASGGGNHVEVAQRLLDSVRDSAETKAERRSYKAESYTFNYVLRDGLVYLCLADEDAGRAAPFAMLDALAAAVEPQFGARARQAIMRGALNSEIAPLLRAEMARFAEDRSENGESSNERLYAVQGDLDRVKGVMQENISLVLERGDKLDDLVVHSDRLMDASAGFRSGATRLQRTLWWNDTKARMGMAAGGALLVYLLLVNACGGAALPECL